MVGKEAVDTGIALSQVAFTLALYLLLPVRKLPASARIALLAGVALLGFVPFRGLRLADYMRSIVDDLAITTLLWLAWCAVAKIRGIAALSDRQHRDLTLCFGFLALLLYPATLGLSMYDPYRLGYSPQLLAVLVFAISIALWLMRHYFGAALLTIATLSFILDIKASGNLWGYLIDPLLGLYCLFAVLGHMGKVLLHYRKGDGQGRRPSRRLAYLKSLFFHTSP